MHVLGKLQKNGLEVQDGSVNLQVTTRWTLVGHSVPVNPLVVGCLQAILQNGILPFLIYSFCWKEKSDCIEIYEVIRYFEIFFKAA